MRISTVTCSLRQVERIRAGVHDAVDPLGDPPALEIPQVLVVVGERAVRMQRQRAIFVVVVAWIFTLVGVKTEYSRPAER